MSSVGIDKEKVSSFRLESGKVNKPAPGPVRVNFQNAFVDIPNVVLTSHYENQGAVNQNETLIVIRPDFFDLTSENAAQEYDIQWPALGRSA
jgi:hypothetical protein